MAMPPRDSFHRGMDLREVVDGSMLILPRACLEKGKELKWTAQQKYHESITFFSQFLEVRRW